MNLEEALDSVLRDIEKLEEPDKFDKLQWYIEAIEKMKGRVDGVEEYQTEAKRMMVREYPHMYEYSWMKQYLTVHENGE